MVRPTGGEDNFDLAGYGFGTSSSGGVVTQLCSLIGNAIHMAYLRAPGLSSDVRLAKPIVWQMGLLFSQDAFRQVCTVNLLARYLHSTELPKRILVIGDGHGILSALLHARYPEAKICLIDLGAVLFFQAFHLRKAFPQATQSVVDEDSSDGENSVFQFCPAELLDRLPADPVDIALNVASMQEMDPSAISNYFSVLRIHGTRLFYCCNRLEKRMPGGEITRFMDYPWSAQDEHLVDELCPWHQWFFGYGSSPHVEAFGLPLPLMHRFASTCWHRLTRLSRTA